MAFLLVVIAIGGLLVFKWPFTEQRFVESLEKQTGRKVTVKSFCQTYIPPGLIATNVRFLRHQHPELPPLISVEKAVVKGSWANLLTFHHAVPEIEAYGMQLSVPPRGTASDGKTHTLITPSRAVSKTSLEIGLMRFHGVLVDFLPGADGKMPFRINIRELTLTKLGTGQALGFEGIVENPLPRGDVKEKGLFGPWNSEEPSLTPIEGTFRFDAARLADIPGISGVLATSGDFKGTLDRIHVNGSALVPDFRVARSLHRQRLQTTYQASVDASNGNVLLEQFQAAFNHTVVHAEGTVTSVAGQKGRLTALTARVVNGRAEDLENMFTRAATPPLTGAISLHTSIRLPGAGGPFLKRLEMAGSFKTAGDRFNSAKTQDLINRLTEGARGESKREQNQDARTVHSAMTGDVVVKGGLARITNVLLTAPDTAARLDGSLDLISKEVNLRGTLKTKGKLSDTQSGFKAFAMKFMTPFLKKDGATSVPFKIQGTLGDLKTGLNLGAKHKL